MLSSNATAKTQPTSSLSFVGAIEISQEYDHLKRDSGDRVEFPLGLLVEKWLLYYYPLIASPDFIPQKNGESRNSPYQIKFRKSFRKVTEYYDTRGGFSAFYSDYVNGKIPNAIDQSFRELVSDLKTTHNRNAHEAPRLFRLPSALFSV